MWEQQRSGFNLKDYEPHHRVGSRQWVGGGGKTDVWAGCLVLKLFTTGLDDSSGQNKEAQTLNKEKKII